MTDNEKLIGELEQIETNPLAPIPLVKTEYINITGKQGNLLNRVLLENTEIKNGKISIKFSEPIWVYDLTFWLAGDNLSKAEKLSRHVTAELTYARGGRREIPMTVSESYIDCYPKDFLSEIEIKFFDIKKSLISSPPLCKNIEIKGLSASDLYDFGQNVSSYIATSKKFTDGKAKLIQELRELNQKIAESEESLDQMSEATKTASELLATEEGKLNNAQLEFSKMETKVGVLDSRSSDLQQRIEQNEQNNKNIVKSIQDNKEELQRLLANKNVFMEEFSSYVEQGKGNVTTYIYIGCVLLSIVLLCLWRLIASALTLANDPSILSTVSAYELFISRLPIAFVLGTIIAICMKLLSTLLSKIFEIHQERLLLSKLSILAKENSFSSAEGLDIPGESIYDMRISLKMELLKEFLSGNYRGASSKEKAMKNKFEYFKENFRKNEKKQPETSEPEEHDHVDQ